MVAARWLAPHESPFGIEVLDFRDLARTMIACTGDPEIAARFVALRNSSGEELRGVQPKGSKAIQCALSYPHKGQLQQGPVFKAKEMEDKWNIYLLDGYLYFTRSWTGDLVFRAQVEFGEGKVHVATIETALGDDDTFLVLQVDFLVKSHILGLRVPHPLPRDMHDVQELAVYSFSHYGRRGLYGLVGDTSRIVPEEPDPLLQFEDRIAEADTLITEMSYDEAAGHLQGLLGQLPVLQGSPTRLYMAFLHERLGTCHLHSGRPEEARKEWETALRLCEQDEDKEGTFACLKNLYEIHRYVADADAAASCADRIDRILTADGQPDEAAWWRRKATMVRAGEPLVRVVVEVDGQTYEVDEVPSALVDKTRLLFERNRLALCPTNALVKQGRELAEAGQFESALTVFLKAAQVDPHDPDPHYQSGLTFLHLRRYAEAVESFARTEVLAPGWFHCRSYRWLAEQLVSDGISHETFLLLRELEGGLLHPEEKVRMAAEGLKETPEVALLYLFHGRNLRETGNREKAEATYREGLKYVTEPDVHTRLLSELGMVVESKEEQRQVLRQAVALNGNLVSATAAALILKAGPVSRRAFE